jgi:hypothetical protein
MKRIAILQSNYIPWKGFFDIIRAVDEVVIYDCCQYTKNDWRNRNLIKKHDGLMWLSIPVKQKGALTKRVCDIDIVEGKWAKTHWKSLKQYYSQTPYFNQIATTIQNCYEECASLSSLSMVNLKFLEMVCNLLCIDFNYSWSMDLCLDCDDPTERVVEICKQRNADEYLSGPTASDYLRIDCFREIGCKVRWMDYSSYQEYQQLHPPFAHGVSILDLLFNVGPTDALNYMYNLREEIDAHSCDKLVAV